MQSLLALEIVCCFLGLAHQDIPIMVLYQWAGMQTPHRQLSSPLKANSVTCNFTKPHVNLQNEHLNLIGKITFTSAAA